MAVYATLGKIFDQTVMKYPDREALVDKTLNKRWTYREWQEDVHRLANAFIEAGVEKGDRVSTFLFNTSELATTFFACAKIGAILNPINFRLQPKEIAYIIEDAKPKIFLFEKMLVPIVEAVHSDFHETSFWYVNDDTPAYAVNYYDKINKAPTVAPDVDVSEDDIYAIMYTSGTTGRPKGVMHRHRAIAEMSLISLAVLKLNKNDIGLVTAPMFHCAELHCCFLPRVHAGASNVIVHHFDPPKVLETIEEEDVSVFFAAPTMWNMLLQQNLTEKTFSQLRLGLYGAAPMAPVLVRAVQEQLGIDLIQAYGQTEMGPAVTFLTEDEQISKAGSAGKACYNHDIRVVRPNERGPADPEDIVQPGEVGEIIIQGPCMMEGYYNRPEATEKALYKGWYHSSDLGFIDKDGYLYIADRVDDMIISGGENVYPREVEDLLHEHEGILDAAVLGEPDEKWGEKVIAFVVKKEESLTADDLEAFCKGSDKLADYKRPRTYYFVKELPRNASGKIQKFLLRKQFEEQKTRS